MQPSHALIKEVQHFLDRFAAAVTKGDGEAATKLREVPALVMGDDMVMEVESDEQVAEFFGAGNETYNAKGITDTRADIIGLEDLTPKVVLVTVRFPWINKEGEEIGGETSTYTLKRDQEGALRIRSSVMHGAETHQASRAIMA